MLRRHPVTGRTALYLGRRGYGYIEGYSVAESDRLLDALWRHMTRPEFVWTHEWRNGDVVMWDNRCCAHMRTAFDRAPEAAPAAGHGGGGSAAGGGLRRRRQMKSVAVRPLNPDFVDLACSFGARPETPDELEAAVAEALRANGPTLIDLRPGIAS